MTAWGDGGLVTAGDAMVGERRTASSWVALELRQVRPDSENVTPWLPWSARSPR